MLPLIRRLTGALLIALVAAPSAQAATRYATPGGGGSTCDAASPCAVADAISGAAAGDDVVLAPGDYAVTATLRAAAAITVEGTPGQPRPRLLGDASLDGDTLALPSGGTARHLEIHGAGPSGAALRLHAATGEDLVLVSTSDSGAAAIVRGSQAGTLLRNALAICQDCGDAAVSFRDDQDEGDATAAGVTAVATGKGSAVSSTLENGTATLVDVALSGARRDVKSGSHIHASFSAYDADRSSGVVDDGGNVGSPVFVNPAAGDYHEAAGSPTIDAGVVDARTGATDLDGTPRDSKPDIGAYETTAGTAPPAAGTGSALGADGTPLTGPGVAGGAGPLAGSLAPAGKPVRGRSVAIRPANGTVKVRLPGAAHDTPLSDAASLPLGAEIDATHGTVVLTSASSARGSQTGLFSGGRFRVRQTAGARPVTRLTLTGGDFSKCPRGGAARAAASGPSRKLWGRDKGGHFSTIGRSASATVRGTRWLTEDTCSGTRITVAEGAVVVRGRRGGRRVLVHAGHTTFIRGAH